MDNIVSILKEKKIHFPIFSFSPLFCFQMKNHVACLLTEQGKKGGHCLRKSALFELNSKFQSKRTSILSNTLKVKKCSTRWSKPSFSGLSNIPLGFVFVCQMMCIMCWCELCHENVICVGLKLESCPSSYIYAHSKCVIWLQTFLYVLFFLKRTFLYVLFF